MTQSAGPRGFLGRIPRASLLAFGVAVLVRLAALGALHGSPFTRIMVGDSLLYRETAAQIVAGRAGEIGVFFQSAPLYPFFLAALALPFGDGWLPVAVAQLLVGSLACAALAALAARACPALPGAGLLAGLGAALYGPLVFHDLEVLPASLGASLLTFALLTGVAGRGPASAAVAGLLLGLAALLTPSLLLVAALVAGWLWWRDERRSVVALRRPAFLIGAVVLAISPVTLHNLAAGDRVLISSNAGVNLFIGNNPAANGAFSLPAGSGLDATRLEASARVAAEAAAARELAPSEVSALWAARARAFALGEPARWLSLLVRKGMLTINHYEIPNHLNFYFLVQRFAPLLGATLPFWIVFPLAGLGAVIAWRGEPAARLLVGTAMVALAVPVVFFVTGRYRLPAAPPMLALAGGGAAWLLSRMRHRSVRPLAAGLALVAMLALATRPRLVREGDYSFDHLLLGSVERRLGHGDAAVIEFKLAEETGPARLDAGYRLAQVLEARGNRPEALAALRRHLERHPDDRPAASGLSVLESLPPLAGAPAVPRTDYEVGVERTLAGEFAAAAAAFERAVRRDPTHVRALFSLGVVRERQGDLAGAVQALRQATRQEPDSAMIWRNLAATYYKAGRREEARAAARRAWRIDPEDPESRALLERVGG